VFFLVNVGESSVQVGIDFTILLFSQSKNIADLQASAPRIPHPEIKRCSFPSLPGNKARADQVAW
jgi:hypothetical protein